MLVRSVPGAESASRLTPKAIQERVFNKVHASGLACAPAQAGRCARIALPPWSQLRVAAGNAPLKAALAQGRVKL
jgi:hypothetical protein